MDKLFNELALIDIQIAKNKRKKERTAEDEAELLSLNQEANILIEQINQN